MSIDFALFLEKLIMPLLFIWNGVIIPIHNVTPDWIEYTVLVISILTMIYGILKKQIDDLLSNHFLK